VAREQQRLIADLGGAVVRLDLQRPGGSAAIAPAERDRRGAHLGQPLQDRDGDGRLARTAQREVTDADDRRAGAIGGLALQLGADDAAIDEAERAEQPRHEAGRA